MAALLVHWTDLTLLKHSADLTTRDIDEITPLHIAAVTVGKWISC